MYWETCGAVFFKEVDGLIYVSLATKDRVERLPYVM